MGIFFGIICFIILCILFSRPSEAERKEQQDQVNHTREVALARMIDLLDNKLDFNNQRANWLPSRHTKNQFEVQRSEISDLIPEFITDRKLREMVWRKGYSFERLSGTRILFVKIDPPSDSEKYVDVFY